MSDRVGGPASTTAAEDARYSGDEPALTLRDVRAGYDGVEVLHGVSFTVMAGEIMALVGANGAGKTTVMSTVAGLMAPTAGSVAVLGTPVRYRRGDATAAALARRGLGLVPEDRGLFRELTVAEHLRLARPGRRGAAGRRDRSDGDRVFGDPIDGDRITHWFPQLQALHERRAGLLSGGEQQMLALAQALVRSPRVLLVDEMSLGLAPLVVRHLLEVLRDIAATTGTAMLIVEQHVDAVLDIADRGCLLRRGEVTIEGAAADLASRRDELAAGYLDR